MKWTYDKIVDWHKKTFPDADLKSQKIKFLEEYREYLESGDITELADMFIVNAVLTHRFNYGRFSNIVYEELLKDDFLFNVNELVDRKMDINAKRTWCKVNGVYRHKED